MSTIGFFIAFAVVRGIAHAVRAYIGPFQDISAGGTHLHHYVWGILLLMLVGLMWLAQVGRGGGGLSLGLSRITAAAYGVACALVLDEFALWLNLQDLYWAKEGRKSIDAVVVFRSLLWIGFIAGVFSPKHLGRWLHVSRTTPRWK